MMLKNDINFCWMLERSIALIVWYGWKKFNFFPGSNFIIILKIAYSEIWWAALQGRMKTFVYRLFVLKYKFCCLIIYHLIIVYRTKMLEPQCRYSLRESDWILDQVHSSLYHVSSCLIPILNNIVMLQSTPHTSYFAY